MAAAIRTMAAATMSQERSVIGAPDHGATRSTPNFQLPTPKGSRLKIRSDGFPLGVGSWELTRVRPSESQRPFPVEPGEDRVAALERVEQLRAAGVEQDPGTAAMHDAVLVRQRLQKPRLEIGRPPPQTP